MNGKIILPKSDPPPHIQNEDPFFSLPKNSDWNACIGTQAHEENYVDGYIEASIELAKLVIQNRMYGSRDTLIMPILYNARHSLELHLKFVISRLCESAVIPHPHRENHDIMSHWTLLESSGLGDEALRKEIKNLEPYVVSLSNIDGDGQELRYAKNREGKKSLEDYSLANLEVILRSLTKLGEVMEHIKYRTIDLVDERRFGCHTSKCSRPDLIEIAKLLPDRGNWSSHEFDEIRAQVKQRFHLGSLHFTEALNVIQGNRQTNLLIGVQSDLLYLSDENILFSINQWKKIHPPRRDDDAKIVNIADIDFHELFKSRESYSEVIQAMYDTLTADEIADLGAIFYIGRDSVISEYYPKMFALRQKECGSEDRVKESLLHLISKANFLQEISKGLSLLGRPDLAEQVQTLEV